jgi:hypothetical protein
MQDEEILDDEYVGLYEADDTYPVKLLPEGQLMNDHPPFQSTLMSGI